MISLSNVARPIAMKALQNPAVLGSLLVGTVGSQQANKIQNELNLGNITLDDVYDTLINFAASPAVSALRDTPSGTYSSPDADEIEELNRKMREFDKKITLPSDSLPKILSTPEPEELPNITSNPIPTEEKVSVDDIGFTAASTPKLSDLIMTMKGDTSNANEKTDTVRQEDGQTAIEALKAQSGQTQRGDVDRGNAVV